MPLLAAGRACREVAELFGEDDTTVQHWIHRFEQGGLQALRESERSGRLCSLRPALWAEFGAMSRVAVLHGAELRVVVEHAMIDDRIRPLAPDQVLDVDV